MRAGRRRRTALGWAVAALLLATAARAEARCAPGLVRLRPFQRLIPVSGQQEARPDPRVSIEWFGHSFFRLISPRGIRIVTDPFGSVMGLPIPEVRPHVITIGREHEHHNSVHIAKGEPIILRGLRNGGADWNTVRKAVGDVFVFSLPIMQRTFEFRAKGSAFAFEMGKLCIVHLGDLAEPLNASQLRRLGKVHVAMVPIGGVFSMSPEESAAFLRVLRPNIAIPMHYWDDVSKLKRFLHEARRVRVLMKGKPLFVSRNTLPPPTQVVVMYRK